MFYDNIFKNKLKCSLKFSTSICMYFNYYFKRKLLPWQGLEPQMSCILIKYSNHYTIQTKSKTLWFLSCLGTQYYYYIIFFFNFFVYLQTSMWNLILKKNNTCTIVSLSQPAVASHTRLLPSTIEDEIKN